MVQPPVTDSALAMAPHVATTVMSTPLTITCMVARVRPSRQCVLLPTGQRHRCVTTTRPLSRAGP